MTIAHGKDGKFSLEPTAGNIEGIARIVLGRFEEKLKALEAADPRRSPTDQRALARKDLMTEIPALVAAVEEACRRALTVRPAGVERQDLLGRLLMRPLEPYFVAEPFAHEGFSRHLIVPVLTAVRTIMGEPDYQKLNEFSLKPSLEFCLVHDLTAAEIDWNEFYNRNLGHLMLKRCRNVLVKWLAEPGNGANAFAALVNRHSHGDGRPFEPRDWHLLVSVWQLVAQKTDW